MGDSHWVAMAGGFQLVGLAVLAGWAVLASCAPLAPVQLATFDGASGSTHKWEAVSDPVMGGQSYANFSQANGVGQWQGEVKIVHSCTPPGSATFRPQGSATAINSRIAQALV